MGFRDMQYQPLVAVLLLLIVCVRAELVDIKPYYSIILEHHNGLRKSVSPQASDMREMMWDEGLARDAEQWAKYCRYERPPRHMYGWGANVHYQRRHVNSRHSVRTNVVLGLKSWEREITYFQYGISCGRACSYVQMIYSSTYRVGCAMNTCNQLTMHSYTERHSTLFICFYAPKGRLMGTYPYRSGFPTTECPPGTRGYDGLCTEGNSVALRQAPLREPDRTDMTNRWQQVPGMSDDGLTSTEMNFILQMHNMYRKEEGFQALQWDSKLKRWTDWIVNCKTDYPGPPHSYTSFARCPDHMPVYEVVYDWRKEANDVHIQMDGKGCRTPYDNSVCNHNTNMMQPRITAVACSACNCGDGMRQLVCVYDNEVERRFRGY